MTPEEQTAQRDADIEKILDSKSTKKVILAGPGTGKSFLLAEAIKRKKSEGKSKFHAITFLGKLEHSLADDLAGLSETSTLHSFARAVVLNNLPTWRYFKNIKEIIFEDLEAAKSKDITLWSLDYQKRSEYYKATGDADVVYLAVQLMKQDASKIPLRDLYLIDEYQDFNDIENEFIELLATKSEIIIVGDDDQALYLWKGGDPKYIRDKYHSSNTDYESFTLRWCNRCPEVIVDSFHSIANSYNHLLRNRVSDKEYICFIPKKGDDSRLNPKIGLITAGRYQIAKQIKYQLKTMLLTQSIKSVLIIGEDKSTYPILTTVAKTLREYGFNNVNYKYDTDDNYFFDIDFLEAYKMLNTDESSILSWRVLIRKLDANQVSSLLENYNNDADVFIRNIAEDFKQKHIRYARAIKKLKDGPESTRAQVSDNVVDEVDSEITEKFKNKREIFTRQLIKDTHHISSPLSNLEITVCNIMGSKGLGADVVFLVGFDHEKLPAKTTPTEGEVYQFLVALTRTKKKMYLVNTYGCNASKFLAVIDSKNIDLVENIF